MTGASRERATAARLLRRVVVAGRTTDQAMATLDVSPLTRELVLGSLRHLTTLSALVDEALTKPLRTKDQDLKFLMIVGAYQLKYLRVPDHAAIFETVQACGDLRKPWAKGLLNAVLRQVASRDDATIERSFEHPGWLETALREEYGDADGEAIMRANNQRAPMALRINLARTGSGAYRDRLAEAGLSGREPRAAGYGAETLILDEACPIETLPGYADGLVAVQDAGAQLAAPLLNPARGDHVLDACAAPGGKLFHLLERCPGLDVTALERQPARLDVLRAEARRLGHEPLDARAADATGLDWWDGRPFRYVLLDAPCSGTGTLRRHPEIRLLRGPGDLAAMTDLQSRLLANLWRVLEPGGTLLYCTCSILAAENDAVVGDFLALHQDAVAEAVTLATGRAKRHGWQLLPTDPDTDGFYFARLTRARSNKARA